MKKFSKQELNDAFNAVTKEYMYALIQLMVLDEEYKQFNFFKTTMKGTNGETYLLSVQHVSGPVVDLDSLRQQE